MLLAKNLSTKMIYSILKSQAYVSSIAPGIESRKPENLDTNMKGNLGNMQKITLCCGWKSGQLWKTLSAFVCVGFSNCALCDRIPSSGQIYFIKVQVG